ncbi:MAG TPA: recombinase family protein, partial [Propionibacteriaceae bacterium]|nr:recombinase family protein [Propionibacteriaceae bacterium]
MYFHQAGPGHRGPEHGKEISSAVGLPPATAYAQYVPHEKAESVPTQIANGTKYAERMGWEVVRVFKDKGLSGYTGEIRPGFEEMIEFLGGGQADVLIARHHDRLTRNP